ncbi:MAG: hypothetical protein HGB18_05455 [Candidatus Moranbacteria bacterium]|nr:hypothetical protein [Candidatus Moranbacteria bacterium]
MSNIEKKGNGVKIDTSSARSLINWKSPDIPVEKYGVNCIYLKEVQGFVATCPDNTFDADKLTIMERTDFDKMVRHQASRLGMTGRTSSDSKGRGSRRHSRRH